MSEMPPEMSYNRLTDAATVLAKAHDEISSLWNASLGAQRTLDSDRLAGASRALRRAQHLLEETDEIG